MDLLLPSVLHIYHERCEGKTDIQMWCASVRNPDAESVSQQTAIYIIEPEAKGNFVLLRLFSV